MRRALTALAAGPGGDDLRRAGAPPAEPTLEARAILPADASAPAPFPGAPDTEPQPQPGARQPVGGFSALIDAPGRDRYWAMPDNGFGSKANSRSFLLRLYEVEADWETARGGDGEVEIEDWITLSDPHRRVPFAIVNEDTRDRLLTGGDFDIESVRIDRRGDLWFGDEFGPYLLHTDRHGRVKEAPIPLPGVRSPDSAEPGTPNLARSNGFEGMAISKDGRTLYPVLEGPVAGDDTHVRRVYEFDLDRRRYEPGWREYRVARPSTWCPTSRSGTAIASSRSSATTARASRRATSRRSRSRSPGDGAAAKRRIADLLDLRDPAAISLPGRPGDIGLGDPFSMPYQTIEAVLPLGRDRLAIVNDTNFGSRGRNPDLPDYSDFIVISTPRPSRDARTLAIIGDTPYGDEQEAAFPRLVADVNDDPDVESGRPPRRHQERQQHLRRRAPAPPARPVRDVRRPVPATRRATTSGPTATGPPPAATSPPNGSPACARCSTPRPSSRSLPSARRSSRTSAGRTAAVTFALVHVVGSDNGLAPWFGGAETPAQRHERLAEVAAREAAALEWIDRAFDAAERERARGVVIGMQADTFAGSTAFDRINARLEERARALPATRCCCSRATRTSTRPTGRSPGAPNLVRVVVEGETASEWLRLTVDPRSRDVFAWSREQLPP